MWSGRVSFDLGICIAMICSTAALAPFFISAVASPLFGGQLMPTRIGLGRIHFAHIEGNAANFGVSVAMLVLGRLILL
jgi:hypothetical protein